VGFDEYFSNTLHSVTLKMGPTPMLRFFWDFDPRPTYAHVRAPVLAVFGEADTLCAPEESVPAVRDALAQGGNHDLTVVVAPGAGHYLQVAGPQGLDFAPGVVEQVAGWVAKRLGSAGRPGEAGPR
jgi:pimeloyl-ACP methyl ester carboxylesterase